MSKVDITMPQMGESITEGTIVKWLKKEGDKVEEDEMLLEISTDKVDSEIPSPESGIVKKILISDGETVEVGDKIAEIETDGAAADEDEEDEEAKQEAEEAKQQAKKKKDKKEAEENEEEEPAKEAEAKTAKGKGKKEKKAKAEEQKEAEEKEQPKKKEAEAKQKKVQEQEQKDSAEEDEESEGQQRADEQADAKKEEPDEDETKDEAPDELDRGIYSPLVRSIAREENIDEEELAQIEGSGSNGRVTKKDILDYIKRRSHDGEDIEEETEDAPAEPDLEDDRTEVITMGAMRKSIAEHMLRSVKTSPHVFAVSEADMTELVRYRTANKETFLEKTGTKLTYMPFIVQACTKALLDFPLVNSSVDGDKIIRKKYINIGVAVALENNGLIVPVVKNADELSLVGVAKKVSDLVTRARGKKLKPDEVQDGTFSITNMGSFGSIMGLPIINQPQVAILGVGVIQKRPVVVNEAIAIRDMLYVSLSFDHRIVDGAMAGQFLDKIAQYLTSFDTNDIL